MRSPSEAQKKVIDCKRSKLAVKACPGSGKTYCVACYLIDLLRDWKRSHQGIAVLSFSNVAGEEIIKTLKDHEIGSQQLSHPHFIGTIDSFINQNIFLPHAHKVMGCDKRPEMVGPPFGTWGSNKKGKSLGFLQFTNLAFQMDGSIRLIDNRAISKDKWEESKFDICMTKVRLNKSGYVTQSDSIYYSYLLLKKYPLLARALAIRYPVLIIDEVQDTSEMQMKIIDKLIESGVEKIFLVGDPDQGIFEWRQADPRLFLEKFLEWGSDDTQLLENWRSSQAICDFTQHLSTLDKVAKAVNNDVKNLELPPIIIGYDKVQELENVFIGQIRNAIALTEIRLDKTAILVRSKNLLKEILNISDGRVKEYWKSPFIEKLCKGKFLFDNDSYTSGFHLIEKVYASIMRNKEHITSLDLDEIKDEFGIGKWRAIITKMILKLPKTDLLLGDWCENAQKVMNSTFQDETPELKVNRLARAKEIKDIFISDQKCMTESGIQVCTIHSVKGQTLDAVMLVVKSKVANNKSYRKMFKDNVSPVDEEELRNIYVGMTRPSKLLVVAVPNSDLEHWQKKFNQYEVKTGEQILIF